MHEQKVEPATELLSDLRHARNLEEAQSFVEPDRPSVGGIDARDHDVLARVAGVIDQRIDERSADTATPAVFANVDRVLDREPVAGPSPVP